MRLVVLAIILSVISISCSVTPDHDSAIKFENLKIDHGQYNQSTNKALPTRTMTKQIKTATPETVKNTPTIQPTKTAIHIPSLASNTPLIMKFPSVEG